MRFREGDRVVVSDPDGRYDHVRGLWYPHGEVGGTILRIGRDSASALVEWDCDVSESFVGSGSWISFDYLAVERENISIEINDSLLNFLVNA